MLDMKAPSRNTELITLGKIFQLKFSYFLSPGPVMMVIPRFIVPKMIVDNEMVVDICCVWDFRIHGHTRTLLAPRFMLPTAHNVRDQVEK